MPSFSEVESLRPPSSVVVPVNAFATTWSGRPDDEVCIGLRFVADVELEDARLEAFRRAKELVPNHQKSEEATEVFIASFHDTLIRWIIARGTCDPNDALKSWSGWAAAPEDIVRTALTDHGAQLLFDAWERMRIESNIGMRAATDDDIALLPDLLKRLPKMTETHRLEALRIRRLLRFVLEELETVED